MDNKALTILVVDDTEAQRYAIAHALRHDGFQVVEASCGEQALEASSQRPDLILLDVKLPDIDGYQVCRRLKSNAVTADIPVIQFSAHFVDADYRIEGLKHGADDYIANPASTEELVIKVNVWARVRRAEAELKRKNEELAAAKRELELRLRATEEAQVEQARTQATLDAARQQALFFASALQESSQAFAAGSVDGRLLHYNQAFVRLTGYSAEELKAASWSEDLTPPEWRDHERRVLEDLHRTGHPQVYQKEYIRKDGTRVPLEIKVHLGRNADGSDYYYAFLTDITQRKKAEARLLRFYDTNLFAILYWTIDGGVIDVNDKFLQMTGYTREDVKAGRLNWARMTPPEYLAMDEDARRQVRETGVHLPYEKEYIRKDGTRVWGLFAAAAWEDNRNEGVSFILDLSERKRAELELHHAKEAADTRLAQLRTTLDNLYEAVYLCDTQGRPLLANAAFQRFTGCDITRLAPEYDVITQQFALFELDGKPANVADRPTNAALRGEIVTGRVFRLAGQPGGDKIVSYNAAPVRDQHGNIIMAVISIQDITARRKAEQALRDSEERFRLVLENMSEGLMLFDASANLIYQNPASLRIHGFDQRRPDEPLGKEEIKATWEAWDSEGRPLTFDEWPVSRVFRNERFQDQVLRALRIETGQEFYGSYNGSPLHDSAGNLIGGFITIRDITEHKRAEQALRESEERFRVAQDLSPDGFLIFRPLHDDTGLVADFLWIYENDAAARMNDTDPEQVCGKRLSEVLPHHERSPFHKAYKEVAETGEVRILEEGFYDQDTFRQPRWFRVVAVPTSGGDVAVLVQDVTERKTAEEALRESYHRLEKVLEVETVGVMFWDLNTGCMVDANDTFLKLMGYSRNEVNARELTWQKLTPPEYLDMSRAEVKKFLATGRVGPYEKEYFCKDGTRRWLLFAGSSLGNNQCVEFCIDISDRKKAERAVRERETQFRSLANAIPTLCWMANADGWIFWYNDRWYDYTGTTPEQMKGWGWQSVHDPAMLPEVLQRWKQSIATAEPFEMVFPLRGADGVLRPFLTRIVPIKDSEGKVVRWFGTNTDVTELRNAQDALRQSEARFRATVENIPQIVWVAGAGADFVYLSPKWLDYTGTSDAQMANGGWVEAIHPEDRERALERWNTALSTNAVYEAEYRLRRHDGEYRWHFSRGVPIPESQQGRRLWFGTTTDIHDQKRTQELLIRSEKVAALGRMAASLAHDINNPLAAAMNTLYLARSSNGSSTDVDQYLESADEELKRISHITRQALGFYRENSKPAPVSIDAIMDEAVAVLTSKVKLKRIQVEKSYEPDCIAIANAGELRQVFCNLLANSVDAVADNGIVKLRVSSVSYSKTGDRCVRITVADNGAGIDRKFMCRLFEPLFSTKGPVGTGLGLWVSNQLVEKHGGSIRVRSATNGSHRGTTFSILLPASTAVTSREACSSAGD